MKTSTKLILGGTGLLGLVGTGLAINHYRQKSSELEEENTFLRGQLSEKDESLKAAEDAVKEANKENVKLAYALGKNVMRMQNQNRLVGALRNVDTGNKATSEA